MSHKTPEITATALNRNVCGHEGSTLNDNIRIHSDDRDSSGGAHLYQINVFQPCQSGGLMLTGRSFVQFQNGPLKETGHNGISDEALLAYGPPVPLKDLVRGARSTRATSAPCCLATGARPGSGLPSVPVALAVSPMTKISG